MKSSPRVLMVNDPQTWGWANYAGAELAPGQTLTVEAGRPVEGPEASRLPPRDLRVFWMEANPPGAPFYVGARFRPGVADYPLAAVIQTIQSAKVGFTGSSLAPYVEPGVRISDLSPGVPGLVNLNPRKSS